VKSISLKASLKFIFMVDVMKTKNSPALPAAQLRTLMNDARKVAKKSYSPYSKFKVGAALLLSNGEVVTGTNVESISYGLTICAERSALVSAVSRFGPKFRILAVAVTNLNGGASPPCGACRQLLSEFIEPDAPIVFATTSGLRTMTFTELLPEAFGIKLK
jgi:cytidine deaminase